ncbi:hypothetical protein DM01DRAFT_1290764 [Hesseltinella vesiculosa]|uniref:SDE2-like domain-containing protein n=1 Tax=Hesseltinella vesiculosa TaxID=101127 RepID=A0A1X2GBT4_9FUNG|nr:hypothetical protein DM01DRAFT_1290764 [Hesseltinella vesiculosa]
MGYQQLIVQLPTQTVCYDYSSSTLVTGSSVKQQLCDQYNLEASSLILANLGGRILLDNAQLFTTSNTEQLSVHLRLRGGKGGFGSLLRSQGGRMNSQKTTNFDACRDLQGRRLRDVEAQK